MGAAEAGVTSFGRAPLKIIILSDCRGGGTRSCVFRIWELQILRRTLLNGTRVVFRLHGGPNNQGALLCTGWPMANEPGGSVLLVGHVSRRPSAVFSSMGSRGLRTACMRITEFAAVAVHWCPGRTIGLVETRATN